MAEEARMTEERIAIEERITIEEKILVDSLKETNSVAGSNISVFKTSNLYTNCLINDFNLQEIRHLCSLLWCKINHKQEISFTHLNVDISDKLKCVFVDVPNAVGKCEMFEIDISDLYNAILPIIDYEHPRHGKIKITTSGAYFKNKTSFI